VEGYLCSVISLEGKCKINEALYKEIEAEKASAGRSPHFAWPPIEMRANSKATDLSTLIFEEDYAVAV